MRTAEKNVRERIVKQQSILFQFIFIREPNQTFLNANIDAIAHAECGIKK